jgi:hypothetical protein|tara:strand:+ start:954 stop:1088 length:135 start_codon:yes stop_codon:yes gene_type:complete
MPFKSEKQRRYLAAKKPKVFKKWAKKYGGKIQPKKKTTKRVKKR